MKRLIIGCILLMLPMLLVAAPPALLTGIRIQPAENHARVEFYLSRQVPGHIRSFVSPYRLQVDFVNVRKQFTIKNAYIGNEQLQLIDVLDLPGSRVRFIFAAKSKISWKTSYVTNNNNVTLQLDLNWQKPIIKKKITSNKKSIQAKLELNPDVSLQTISSEAQLEQEIANAIAAAKLDALTKQQTTTVVKIPDKKPQKVTIVIDPGHGGKDSGARGPHGIYEKDVVLAIAKRLAKEINQHPNWRAVLTRNGDYFISLAARLRFARKYKADLFVAVHADAYFNNRARGASVYALSQHSATSLAARWLAQRENHSELGGIEFENLKDQSNMLRSVLIDLALTNTKQNSLQLGSKVLDALDDISALHSNRVKQAPFMVLKSPDIPSILVETGFISNPREEKNLNNSVYQQKMAEALGRGITQYMRNFAHAQ